MVSNWPRNSTPTIRSLVCGGLGYCCLWAFFKLHKRTAVIATRLGVSKRAVQQWKVRFREGCLTCEHKKDCLQMTVLRR